jgi:CHAT domain-containing protein/tetratricopeptide (TPR) repeat protein
MEDLLLICAVARWFDQELIKAITGESDERVAAWLAAAPVERRGERPGQLVVRAAARAELLSSPAAGQAALSAAHGTLLRARLGRARDDELDDVRYHLDELFSLLKQRADWSAILGHVERARHARLPGDDLAQRLDLYEGYALVNTYDYERGTGLLSALLERPDLPSDLRLQALSGLAQASWYQTHFDRAIGFYQRVLDLATEDGNRLYQALALLNIGGAYNELHYFDQALAYGLRSLPIFRALGERTREAHALYQIGVNAMYLGRWQLAREHFGAAIERFEALGHTHTLAYLHWADGFLHHMLGAEPQSEQAYARALAIAQHPDHDQPYLAQEILKDLGFLLHTQRRWGEALACYARASELAAGHQGAHRVSQLHYRRGAVYQAQGRADEALAAYAEAIAGFEALRGDSESEEIKLGLVGTAQQAYEVIVLLLLERGRPEEAFHYVERARSRAFLDTLARRDPELFARFDQPVATLDEVRAALPEGALLLEYFTAGVLPRGEHLANRIPEGNTRLRQHLAPPPQTWIFAVTRGGLEVYRAALDPNTIRPHPGDPGPGQRLLRERLLVSLYERLIAPCAHLLAGRELLYLTPHGPLHYVPFMALRSADGRHLLERDSPALALAPSATVLLRNCLAQPRRAASRPSAGLERALAIGYNDEGVEALRFAEAEAAHVARLTGGESWIGPAPKSARLAAEAGRLRRLHIAGHAVYNPRDPLGSELRLGAGDTLAARDIMGGMRLEADLVTLSACTSGLSHVVSGDELLGLQRAFLAAGATTVVCTLWEAADLVALLVMDRFYRDVVRGISPAAALRDAQVAVRDMTGRELMATLQGWRDEAPAFAASLGELPIVPPEHLDTRIYADPFYWAPFMLIGRPA